MGGTRGDRNGFWRNGGFLGKDKAAYRDEQKGQGDQGSARASEEVRGDEH
jgi:hypothetical protein